ncbi:Tyrosine recombinase XerC [bioreactor metagenome]|uniref:Tyrosine recombinase XerC n=1 Tax=bioreactor metagenome TaxID=1076179 RepID=A0A644YPF2_9ZZZZ
MECLKCHKSIPDDAIVCCYCGKRLGTQNRKAKKRPNGTGCIYKLGGNRVKPWGIKKNGTFLGAYSTKAMAIETLEKLQKKPVSEAYNFTLEEVRELWKKEHYPVLSEKGRESYDLAWSLFEPIKENKMRDIRTEDVQKLVDVQVSKGRSRSQCEKIRGLYSQLCKVAMREDILDKNYALFLRLPKSKRPDRLVFTEKEIKMLKVDAKTNDTSKIILMLIYTGFRINELLQLPKAGVNLEKGIFTGGEKTEAGKNRVVPIHPEILAYVQEFMREAKEDLFLSGYAGNKDDHNFRSREYYPTLERLGIRSEDRPMKPHTCRYTFATRGAKSGVSQEALQKLMGHAKYDTTTDFYIQDDVDMLKKEMKKLK